MSTIQTISLGNPPSTPQVSTPSQVNTGFISPIGLPPIPVATEQIANTQTVQTNQGPNKLLTDAEIDQLINSQIKETPKVNETIINNIGGGQNTPPPPTQAQTTKSTSSDNFEPNTEDKQEVLSFDLNSMNTNLEAICRTTAARIKELIDSQNKLKARTNLLEKFINLDERELAVEVSKQEPNTQKIIGIRKAILSQTELLSTTLDILLKFEGSIQTWTKTLIDIEKDKVAAYHKIKSINKEQASTETDINEVLTNINQIIKSDPTKAFAAIGGNGLNINGYAGKKFNQ